MKFVEQSHAIMDLSPNILSMIERAGRTCYKSEKKITPDSALSFVKMIRDRGHHAMLEFGNVTVKLITNRGVTHELVRHRLCSFAQESTRYVNYGGNDIEFIQPVWLATSTYRAQEAFIQGCKDAEECYKYLLANGWRPEQAREILPNALKTEIVVSANTREWRHIFSLRCSKKAHPQMRALMLPCLKEFKSLIPVLYDDIEDE